MAYLAFDSHDDYEDYLMHYGRKGMKKGMNIFNPDYKPKGKKAETGSSASEAAKKASATLLNQGYKNARRREAKKLAQDILERGEGLKQARAKVKELRKENNPEAARIAEKATKRREKTNLKTEAMNNLEDYGSKKENRRDPSKEAKEAQIKNDRSNSEKAADKASDMIQRQGRGMKRRREERERQENVEKGKKRQELARQFTQTRVSNSINNYNHSKIEGMETLKELREERKRRKSR